MQIFLSYFKNNLNLRKVNNKSKESKLNFILVIQIYKF